ncbi:hypothetical protein B566_EDAN007119 [Ephemera danica]|nr:hypothetical protein B566_EDAN007119 [Ephemera danica]
MFNLNRLPIMDSETHSFASLVDMDDDEEAPIEPVKRKHKSLLTLCKRFLEMYPLEMPPGCSSDIPLEHLSDTLKLSRRRLYDIINIMESLQMAVKVTKNLYRWYGTRNVHKLLTQLKHLSDQNMTIELDNLVASTALVDSPVPTQPPCTPVEGTSAQSLLLRQLTQAPPTPSSSKTRHYNLAVSLDWAGRVLLCGPEDEKSSQSSQEFSSGSQSSSQDSQEAEDEFDSKEADRQLRNKVRRIYDVANVLCALGLVCKIRPQRHNSRKLLYVYCGPAIGDSLQPFPIQGVTTLITEPTKPVRRPKNIVKLEKVDPKPSSEGQGLCKRKLDLGNGSDCAGAAERKKALVDEVMLELDESSSALSVLLAVAERELVGMSGTQTDQTTSASGPKDDQVTGMAGVKVKQATLLKASTINQNYNIKGVTKSSPLPPQFKSQRSKLPSPKKSPPKVPHKCTTNQENTMDKPIIPTASTHDTKPLNNGGRSALRSLLENNLSKASAKSDFPAIRKFVVCNEANILERRPIFITPFTSSHAGSSVQTVLIRNPSVRRGSLVIPFRKNNDVSMQPVTTRLDMGKVDSLQN